MFGDKAREVRLRWVGHVREGTVDVKMVRMKLPEETLRRDIWMYKGIRCEEKRMNRIGGAEASMVLLCSDS